MPEIFGNLCALRLLLFQPYYIFSFNYHYYNYIIIMRVHGAHHPLLQISHEGVRSSLNAE